MSELCQIMPRTLPSLHIWSADSLNSYTAGTRKLNPAFPKIVFYWLWTYLYHNVHFFKTKKDVLSNYVNQFSEQVFVLVFVGNIKDLL